MDREGWFIQLLTNQFGGNSLDNFSGYSKGYPKSRFRNNFKDYSSRSYFRNYSKNYLKGYSKSYFTSRDLYFFNYPISKSILRFISTPFRQRKWEEGWVGDDGVLLSLVEKQWNGNGKKSQVKNQIESRNKSRIGDWGKKVTFPQNKRIVVAKDLFIEKTHFLTDWYPDWKPIGKKAILVNVSDILAMGAFPRYLLLGVGFPKATPLPLLRSLAVGIREETARWGMEIVGGDTIGSDRLILSITIIGEVEKPIWRRLKMGDEVAITGIIPSFRLGMGKGKFRKTKPTGIFKGLKTGFKRGAKKKDNLKKWERRSAKFKTELPHRLVYPSARFKLGRIGESYWELSRGLKGFPLNPKSKFYLPKLPARFIFQIKGKITGGMDTTDGLSTDLHRLEKLNRVGIKLYHSLLPAERCSGEEYEFLFSYPIRFRRTILRRALKSRTPITLLGRVKRGKMIRSCPSFHF